MQMDAAIEYARKHALEALVITRGGETLACEYGDAFEARTPHALYSGTKSFWGPVALAAQSDGLLELDETVASTVESWRDDPWKRRVTLRMLLVAYGRVRIRRARQRRAGVRSRVGNDAQERTGTAFTYGGIALQVFGAVLARKLAARSQTPHDYLRERILRPAGVEVAKWRTLSDGTHPLPTGAFLTAENWLAYGRYVLRERDSLAECFTGSAANARYGLGWWLGASACALRCRIRERCGRPGALSRAVARRRHRALRKERFVQTRDVPQTPSVAAPPTE